MAEHTLRIPPQMAQLALQALRRPARRGDFVAGSAIPYLRLAGRRNLIHLVRDEVRLEAAPPGDLSVVLRHHARTPRAACRSRC